MSALDRFAHFSTATLSQLMTRRRVELATSLVAVAGLAMLAFLSSAAGAVEKRTWQALPACEVEHGNQWFERQDLAGQTCESRHTIYLPAAHAYSLWRIWTKILPNGSRAASSQAVSLLPAGETSDGLRFDDIPSYVQSGVSDEGVTRYESYIRDETTGQLLPNLSFGTWSARAVRDLRIRRTTRGAIISGRLDSLCKGCVPTLRLGWPGHEIPWSGETQTSHGMTSFRMRVNRGAITGDTVVELNVADQSPSYLGLGIDGTTERSFAPAARTDLKLFFDRTRHGLRVEAIRPDSTNTRVRLTLSSDPSARPTAYLLTASYSCDDGRASSTTGVLRTELVPHYLSPTQVELRWQRRTCLKSSVAGRSEQLIGVVGDEYPELWRSTVRPQRPTVVDDSSMPLPLSVSVARLEAASR